MRASLFLLAACGSGASQHDAAIVADAPPVDTKPSPDAATGDPAGSGSYSVTTQTLSIPGATADRTVPATQYTPSGVAQPALVVISPGFQMPRTQYETYAQHLASWGYEVLLTDYADQGFFADHQLLANDVSAVIDYALPSIDASRIALAGHSLGGDISMLAATADTRVRVVLGWDPVDATTPSVVPEKMATFHGALAVIGETTDASGGGMPCAPAAENFQQFYAAAPSPALEVAFDGADHMDWVDDGSCAFCGLCTAGTADPADVHAATRRLNVAWLAAQFDGDPSLLAAWVPGAQQK